MKKNVYLLLFLGSLNYFYAQTETSGRGLYRATNEKKTELKHTKLKVSFNFDNQTLLGEEWLTAAPYFYESDSLVLNAKSMLIHEVKLGNQNLKYDYKNDFLRIKLDKPYQKNEPYTVYIKYTSQPEEMMKKSSFVIEDNKGLFFINPKGEIPDVPTQVWTQGETESSSVWFPTIDSPNQKTTQEIYLTVPDKFITLSNGILKSSEKANNNQRTDYWVMDKPHAPYLFFFGVGDFAKVEDTPWRGNVPVTYYVEKEYENVAKDIFGHTLEMIEFYSQKFSYDFPWQKYAQIVVRDFVAGAMENTTAVAHAESAHQSKETLADKNYWEAVIAHELAHHWFGDLVTAESWSNLSLNESFANYSEYLWFEYKYGKDKAENHLINSVNRYHHKPTDFEKHLVRFDYEDKDQMFDFVSYNKGGGILHMLRDYLEDEAFFKAVSNYLKNNEFGTGEVPQLRIEFEKVSGKDLNWFFNQWYYGKGNPLVNVTKEYDKNTQTLKLKIEQLQDENILFEFPLEIDIYENQKATRQKVWINAKKDNVFEFKVNQNPELVNINPRGIILMREENNKTESELIYQLKNTKDFKSRFQAIDDAEGKELKAVLMVALDDESADLRTKALNALLEYDLDKKDFDKIEKIAKNDPDNLTKAAAMWALSISNDKKYLPIYEKGLYTQSSAVKNAGINGVSLLSPEKALPILKNAKAKDFTSDQLTALSSVIVANKLEQYLETLIPYFIYYPSFKTQGDDKKAQAFKDGLIWAMNTDNDVYVKKVTDTFRDVAPYGEKDSESNKQILEVLDLALSTKKKLKSSPSIQKQIQALNKVKKLF